MSTPLIQTSKKDACLYCRGEGKIRTSDPAGDERPSFAECSACAGTGMIVRPLTLLERVEQVEGVLNEFGKLYEGVDEVLDSINKKLDVVPPAKNSLATSGA